MTGPFSGKALARAIVAQAGPRVRVPARVLEHMRGGQAYIERASWPEAHDLTKRIEQAPSRKDGSTHLPLNDAERETLRECAEALALAARDDAGWDADARADLNSARATINALDKISREAR